MTAESHTPSGRLALLLRLFAGSSDVTFRSGQRRLPATSSRMLFKPFSLRRWDFSPKFLVGN